MKSRHFALALALCLAILASPVQAAWAVAVGDGGAGGDPIFAADYRNVPTAKRHALEACEQDFNDCKIVATGDYGCLAMASPDKHRWAVEQDRKPAIAAEKAVAACEALTGARCRVEHQFCHR